MIKIQCPSCNSINTELNKKSYYNYQLYACSICHCVFCIPFKAPNADFYFNGNDSESLRRHSVLTKWDKKNPTYNSSLFEVISNKEKTILDIGCGNGAFAEFASERGFNVIGIDIDTSSLKLAKSRNLKNTLFLNSNLEDFIVNNPGIRIDIITMFEVFEHLDNPSQTLQSVYNLLTPGGFFAGTLPNEDRYFAKKLNLKFALPPYHLTYWTNSSWVHFTTVVNQFKLKTCKNNVYYGYISNIFYEKLINKITNKRVYKIVNPIFKAVIYFTKILETIIEKVFSKSSSFYFELQKKI